MTAPYTAGTISLVSGSPTVVGTDTAWEISLIAGGTIYVQFDGGNPLPIATVDSDTEITAALNWTGPTGTYSYAIMRDTAYGQQTVANAQALATYIQRLNNPALAATAGVTPGSNKLLLFTGANSATVIDLEDLLQGVKFDEEVPTLADRATYDGEAEGFRVLVANIGDGRSAFYTKKSAAVGDWTVPFYITGPMGGAGPYTDITIGPTETLPAGSQAEVTLVPLSPGVIRLDFGLPKGEDGTGTGDVVGPAGATDGYLAAFNGTTGKLLKQQILSAFAATILDDTNGAAVWATLGGTSWGNNLNGGRKLPDGTIVQWGFISNPDVNGYTYAPYSQAFPNQIFGFYPHAAGPWVSANNVFVAYQDWDNTGELAGKNVYVRQVNGGSVSPSQVNVRWFAIGR